MNIVAVLNREGGTLRGMEIEALCGMLRQHFEAAGHTLAIRATGGSQLVEAMKSAVADENADTLLAAGGDGTISLAAGLVADTHKTLAVLPAGTMNLFARSLGIPLELETAIEALASGSKRKVDIASANGRHFVHQFSIGLHPHVIKLREEMAFTSRLGKISASVRAGISGFIDPPRLKVRLIFNGNERSVTTSSLVITNNLYGEGQSLPFTDQPDGGTLGLYITRARRRRDMLVLFMNMGLGRWQDNEQVEIHETPEITVTVPKAQSGFRCAMDGELNPLPERIEIKIHPGALSVLVPSSRGDESAVP